MTEQWQKSSELESLRTRRNWRIRRMLYELARDKFPYTKLFGLNNFKYKQILQRLKIKIKILKWTKMFFFFSLFLVFIFKLSNFFARLFCPERNLFEWLNSLTKVSSEYENSDKYNNIQYMKKYVCEQIFVQIIISFLTFTISLIQKPGSRWLTDITNTLHNNRWVSICERSIFEDPLLWNTLVYEMIMLSLSQFSFSFILLHSFTVVYRFASVLCVWECIRQLMIPQILCVRYDLRTYTPYYASYPHCAVKYDICVLVLNRNFGAFLYVMASGVHKKPFPYRSTFDSTFDITVNRIHTRAQSICIEDKVQCKLYICTAIPPFASIVKILCLYRSLARSSNFQEEFQFFAKTFAKSLQTRSCYFFR